MEHSVAMGSLPGRLYYRQRTPEAFAPFKPEPRHARHKARNRRAFTPMNETPAASTAPALSVRDLRKTYDNKVEALKGVSLDVR
jgi:ABC-type glutathione transport system ATPase component